MKQNNNKTKGYIMAGIGFIMIVINALDYILGWNTKFTPLLTIGLVFVVIGMNYVKKGRKP